MLGAAVEYIDGLTYNAGDGVPGWQQEQENVKVIAIENRLGTEETITAEEGKV